MINFQKTADTTAGPTVDALFTLRRFARARQPAEHCELCSAGIAAQHQHLLHRQSRQIVCSCDGCAILFCAREDTKLLRIPRRIVEPRNFVLDDRTWNAMMLPINLAFFFRESNGATVAMYPSPAGAMSSLLELPPWRELFAESPLLQSVEPEVEALLVNRIEGNALQLLVPIDECYRLVGLIRTEWRGLSGGRELWTSVLKHLDELRQRTRPSGEIIHA